MVSKFHKAMSKVLTRNQLSVVTLILLPLD